VRLARSASGIATSTTLPRFAFSGCGFGAGLGWAGADDALGARVEACAGVGVCGLAAGAGVWLAGARTRNTASHRPHRILTPSGVSFSFAIRYRAAHFGHAAIMVRSLFDRRPSSDPEPSDVFTESVRFLLETLGRLAHLADRFLVGTRTVMYLLQKRHRLAALFRLFL